MQITKAIFDEIAAGEIFRKVTTSIHSIKELEGISLTFVCVKAKEGFEGRFFWAIYFASGSANPGDIARYGSKLRGKENILSICPCDEDVLQLYRQ